MNTTTLHSILAMLSGVMLALMVDINSMLAAKTNAFQASWLAHGIGAIVAFILLRFSLWNKRAESNIEKIKTIKSRKLYYLGGIPGAFTVVLASISVQSQVGLAGTLALGLVGQLVFSLLAEHFGWLQLNVKTITLASAVPVSCVAFGASLIIYGRFSA